MVADYQRRFWVSLVLTIPVLILSPMVRDFAGQGMTPLFAAEEWVALALSSIIYFWGGWPFLTGALPEIRTGRPGMMTLVALAISTAYFYSAAVTLGLPGGEPFYWELATLVTIMLLGHWLEMRSVLGASRALEELVRLLPDTALRVTADGGTEEVAVAALIAGDRVVIRPGAKVPVDGVITDGAFVGDGCAISQASADIMLDLIIGEKKEGALHLAELFLKMIKDSITEEEMEELDEAAALQDVAHMPARVKCAVLGWHTMEEMFDLDKQQGAKQ